MKKAMFLLLTPILIYSCTKNTAFKESGASLEKSQVPSVGNPPALPQTYWGVMVNDAKNLISGDPNTNTGNSDPAWAATYGVKFYRMQVNHQFWANGGPLSTAAQYRSDWLTSYADVIAQGLKVVLNVNWDNHGATDGAQAFPDATAYNTFLVQILDAIKGKAGNTAAQKALFKPALVVVENEETFKGYFTQSAAQGTLYVNELTAAATTCKNYTSFDGSRILVTNGGISHRIVTWLAWRKYYNANPSQAAMQSYLRCAVPRSQFYGWYAGTVATPSDVTVTPNWKTTMTDETNTVYNMVSQYASIADLSFVNVHWYEPCNAGGWVDNVDSKNATAYSQNDPTIYPDRIVRNAANTNSVFSESMAAMSDLAGTKPLVSNETGQRTLSDCLTKSMLDAYNTYNGTANFKYLIWYDGDGDTQYGSRCLHDDNGPNGSARAKRPSGTVLTNYMQSPGATCTGYLDF